MRAAPGVTGYPAVELMTLVETGTRALIGAVFGPPATGETDYARQLLHLLTPDMLVLADRGFDAAAFLAEVAATRAQFLVRLGSRRRLPVMARLADGSFLSRLGELTVRVIEAHVTVTCADGTRYTGSYRLATTLLDHRRYPATALIRLYHERWEHEVAYLALRHTLLGGRVLRSEDPAGLQQEIWALLALYQALRRAMVTAVETIPGTDPDRASFTIALETAQRHADRGCRRGHRRRGPHRPHRPRRPGRPAPAPPPARQHPQGQILAIPMEQGRPAPASAQHPGNRYDCHGQGPRSGGSIRDTPRPVLDRHARPLTTRPFAPCARKGVALGRRR
jgi:hypothetical protein